MIIKEFSISRFVVMLKRLKKMLAEMYYLSEKDYEKNQTIDYLTPVKKTVGACGENLFVGGKTSVSPNTWLGDNVSFNGMTISGRGKVVIGDNFHSGPECLIITQVHNYDHGKAIPYDDTYIAKDVLIKDNVWIGSRVILLGTVTVGEGAIIQAGSVVCKDIPDYGVAGGHPATVFKYRDVDHYNKLKEEGKFH